MIDDFKYWFQTQGLWWATSTVAHAVVLSSGLLLMDAMSTPRKPDSTAPKFQAAEAPPIDTEVTEFEVGETPIEPTELSTETLVMTEAPAVDTPEQVNGAADHAFAPAGGGVAGGTSALGGLGGFDVKAIGPGPKVRGAGGIGLGAGFGKNAGTGGAGVGFGNRGDGVRRAMLTSGGGTKQSERAVAAALYWLSRHQNPDGGWGLSSYPHQCKDPSCMEGLSKRGNQNASDVAATAMAVLPFLAAGQTHKTKGPYQKTVYGGLYWLLKTQKSDGDLRGSNAMYAHGLATITLCEAYGLSQDRQIGAAAQQAINFICMAQDPAGGGWRYTPKQAGDTSVVGWQVMGLKSGLMAGLQVPSPVLEGAHKFLKSVSAGTAGGYFGYTDPGKGQTTTAVGLLCSQYMGAQRRDGNIQEGMKFLMGKANLPDPAKKRIYYYYYATQVMHNLPGYEWDEWNRAMRRILIESQETQACAAGSWSPTGDPHADAGGRIMITSLSCLTLEVYYRYLPLYKLDGGGSGPGKDPLKDDLEKPKQPVAAANAAAAK